MRLFLVRHAEAEPGEPDELRPLTADGQAAARALAEHLSAESIDTVLSSPLVRARETAAAIARAAGLEVETDERLAPGATAETLRAAVAGRGEAVVAVGHNPDCPEIVLELTGRLVSFAPGECRELEL